MALLVTFLLIYGKYDISENSSVSLAVENIGMLIIRFMVLD